MEEKTKEQQEKIELMGPKGTQVCLSSSALGIKELSELAIGILHGLNEVKEIKGRDVVWG